MGTYVFIDGFNLYNGAVKGTQYKWLNLSEVCQTLFPGKTIDLIRYFTARVIAFDHDLQAPVRQDVYLRALRTLPNLEIHDEGWFASRPTLLPQYPLAYRPQGQSPPPRPPQMVQVLRSEEKRTDVDIATHLLLDCFHNRFDEAVVISNDGDLASPIQTVRDEFGKRIVVVNPHHKSRISGHLIKASSHCLRSINRKVLANSQFPTTLTDIKGEFAKAPSW